MNRKTRIPFQSELSGKRMS